jgi:spermidine/putrescine-binding protein
MIDLKKVVDPLGGAMREFGPSLVIFVLCVVAAVAELYLMPDPFSMTWVKWVLAVLLFLVAFASLGVYLVEQRRHRRKSLQVIAWAGFAEPEIVKPYEKISRLALLEYVRGIDRVVNLKLEDSFFDVLVTDIEFLDRHNIGKKLKELSGAPFPSLRDRVVRGLRDATLKHCGAWLGIPVRWGLNDIIINETKVKQLFGPQFQVTSYQDLRLDRIIPLSRPECEIGIWNWYLPSLLVMLLGDGVPLHREELANADLDRVKRCIDLILNNPDRFLLFDDPAEATSHLRDGHVWTVLGGGSWMLPFEPEQRRDLKAILPQEGALMWIECAGIINHAEKSERKAASLIEYLLEKQTQRELSRRRAYRTFPATREALEDLGEHIWNDFHLDRVFTAHSYHLASDIVVRPRPDKWRRWEEEWEKIAECEALYHLGPRRAPAALPASPPPTPLPPPGGGPVSETPAAPSPPSPTV